MHVPFFHCNFFNSSSTKFVILVDSLIGNLKPLNKAAHTLSRAVEIFLSVNFMIYFNLFYWVGYLYILLRPPIVICEFTLPPLPYTYAIYPRGDSNAGGVYRKYAVRHTATITYHGMNTDDNRIDDQPW